MLYGKAQLQLNQVVHGIVKEARGDGRWLVEVQGNRGELLNRNYFEKIKLNMQVCVKVQKIDALRVFFENKGEGLKAESV